MTPLQTLHSDVFVFLKHYLKANLFCFFSRSFFRYVGCEQTAVRLQTKTIAPFHVARLCSTFGFANTSSAIKHSDSVEGKSQIQVSHSIHPSFSSYSKKKKKKHLQAIHVSTNLSLHITLLSLCPCQLLFNLQTQDRKTPTIARDEPQML